MPIATNSSRRTHCKDWGLDQRTASNDSRPLSGYIWEPSPGAE
jgi:hypothetical protein